MINQLLEYYKSSHTIISGGQTGADQAGLKAAKDVGFKTGGWAPKDWKTTEGTQKSLLKSYNLKEHTGGYRERTIQNVKDSDITIIISRIWKSPGTILTINACNRARKPYLALFEDGKINHHSINLIDTRYLKNEIEEKIELYAAILKNYLIINCAGNAENNAPGISETAYNLFYDIFSEMYKKTTKK